MPHFNSVTFIGHLARDPEVRHTQKGTALCSCAMGVNHGWGDNKDSFFVDFTIWGKRGEAFDKICAKGDAVLIQGELCEDKWQDKKTGDERKKFNVRVGEWQKISSPRGKTQRAADKPEAQTVSATRRDPRDAEISDDDIPF